MEKLFVPLQSRIPELLFNFSPAILHSDFETLPLHRVYPERDSSVAPLVQNDTKRRVQGQGDNQALLFLGLGIIREVSTPLPHCAA